MTTTTTQPVDLAADREWLELAPAGSDVAVRMAVLHADADRGTRTVLVRFPDGWSRDAVGSQQENLVLGRARAVAVCSALDLPKGVKVVVKTRGERSPVASNRTERGRAKNRRVEITFLR